MRSRRCVVWAMQCRPPIWVLRLALAGDRQDGIRKLIDLVRSGKSDARARQNLALAFALDGRWLEARAVAMQDTPPDRIDGQLAGWAALASPQSGGGQQIAVMLGVKPVNDPGLPTALALVTPLPAVVAAPVAVAVADPAPAVMPVAPVTAEPISVPLEEKVAAAPTADASAAAVVLAAQQASPVSDLVPPSLLREPTKITPRVVPVAPRVPAPITPPTRRDGGYVVQLGAYSKASSIQDAWARASRLMPRLTGYEPARAQFSFGHGALIRLSVSGFANRAEAVKLCERVQGAGGQCFVRATAGDAPLQWVRRTDRTQIASR